MIKRNLACGSNSVYLLPPALLTAPAILPGGQGLDLGLVLELGLDLPIPIADLHVGGRARGRSRETLFEVRAACGAERVCVSPPESYRAQAWASLLGQICLGRFSWFVLWAYKE
jgi:hypothetical protein